MPEPMVKVFEAPAVRLTCDWPAILYQPDTASSLSLAVTVRVSVLNEPPAGENTTDAGAVTSLLV